MDSCRVGRRKLVAAVLLFLAGCGGSAGEESSSVESDLTSADGQITATLQVNHWGAGYCAGVKLSNGGGASATGWSVGIDLGGTAVTNLWSATFAVSGGQVTATSVAYNQSVPAAGSIDFGFCGSGSGRPSIVSVSGTGGTPSGLSITAFSPTSAPAGTSVVISGAGFSPTAGGNTVRFNGTAAVVTAASATSLTATVPAGATTGRITVAAGGETATSASSFTVTAVSAGPAISSFAPMSGAAGTSVTISGSSFSPASSANIVRFNGAVAAVTAASATSLTATVPAGATSGGITVEVGGKTATSPSRFTVVASSGSCSVGWNPPSQYVAGLNGTWDFMLRSSNSRPEAFRNYIWDQLRDGKGALNYCVRVDLETNPGASRPAAITAAQRDQVQAMLERSINQWLESWMTGYDCWPYGHIPVKVVGWAVKDRSTLAWTDNSVPVYVNRLDGGGVPQCDEACGRFFHQDNNYSGCSGGAANHYDMSLWLTNGMGIGGAGGDWGQRVDYAGTMSSLNSSSLHIVLHEIGHGLGLPDFYDYKPPGVSGGWVMNAGSSMVIADFDGWMLRQQWYKFEKARYGY